MVKIYREGVALEPQSTDPVGAVEGQLQYSDGTARDEGVHVFTNGEWVPAGGAAVASASVISLDNPTFEIDSSGWTASDPDLTISRRDAGQLSGQGDLLMTTSYIEQGVPSGTFDYRYASHDFVLNNRLNISQKLDIELDLDVIDQESGTEVSNLVVVELFDGLTLVDSYLLNTLSNPSTSFDNLGLGIRKVKVSLDISSTAATSLQLRIGMGIQDQLANASAPFLQTIAIDNVTVTSRPLLADVGNNVVGKRVTRFLTTSLTVNNSDITELKVFGLKLGKSYRVFFMAHMVTTANNGARMSARHNGTIISTVQGGTPQESSNDRHIGCATTEIVATASTITFEFAENAVGTLEGSGNTQNTHIWVQELDYDIIELNNF